MNKIKPTLADQGAIAKFAGNLLGCPAGVVDTFRTGGNNAVCRIEAGGEYFAFKFYPPIDVDDRNRLETEFEALSFLTANGYENIPRPIAKDLTNNCAIYSWIDGRKIAAPSNSEINQLAEFLLRLQDNKSEAREWQIGRASAACLCPRELIDQLFDRWNKLKSLTTHSERLQQFLTSDFAPVMSRMSDSAIQNFRRADIPMDLVLAEAQQILSPSDFGFHNALIDGHRRICFIDFEYFGWDDPAKAVADVMLHAGMNLPTHLGDQFRNCVGARIRETDKAFEVRLGIYIPVIALIWCLIMLGGFVEKKWKLPGADIDSTDRQNLNSRQLVRAMQSLKEINLKFANC
jgi:thiamine kinase-like enzyme